MKLRLSDYQFLIYLNNYQQSQTGNSIDWIKMKEEESNQIQFSRVLEGRDNKPTEEQTSGNKYIYRIFSKKSYFFINNNLVRIFFILLGILFIIFAIVSFVPLLSIKRTVIKYSVSKKCVNTHFKSGDNCEITFIINQTMPGPVYAVYDLSNLYINHKKYIKSFSKQQLEGKTISQAQARTACTPIIFNRDLPWNTSWGGHALNPDAIANPCGLKPLLFFNDTFKIKKSDGKFVSINETGIMKEISKYKMQPKSNTFQWISPLNEHFQSYMQDRALLTKKRLWGILQKGLEKGNYTLVVNNVYHIHDSGIIKSLQLTTSSFLGSSHLFYPVAFGLIALGCFGYTLFITIKLSKLVPFFEASLRQSYRL